MQHCQTYLQLLGEGVKICARTKHFLYWITWYLCPTKPTAKENSSNIIVIFNQNTSSCVHCIYPNPAITLCIELTTQPDTLEYYYMHTYCWIVNFMKMVTMICQYCMKVYLIVLSSTCPHASSRRIKHNSTFSVITITITFKSSLVSLWYEHDILSEFIHLHTKLQAKYYHSVVLNSWVNNYYDHLQSLLNIERIEQIIQFVYHILSSALIH